MLKVAIGAAVALVLGSVGFVIHHESQKPKRAKLPVIGAHEEVSTISTGERVDVERYVPREDLVLVVFSADFCPACKMLEPQLVALAEQHPKVKLRKVDVQSWQSDVAQQYSIRLLPTLWLYEDGELVTKDSRAVAARLQKLQ